MRTVFVTTPIYYVNDKPHVGHAYATFAADTVARHYRQKLGKENVWFSTGTDENSQKTVEAANKAGKEVRAYTDELAGVWRATFKKLGIEFDDFIRTTEPRHRKAVEDVIAKIEASGDIYKGKYEGWYCVGHEAFLKESELVDGKCPEHNRKAEWLVEENYFFKLSKYQKPLQQLFVTQKDFVVPETRFNEVKSFVDSGLEDISISRATQKWGIPLPQDPKQVVYVWFDALINYLTTLGYPNKKYTKFWPGVHIVGKDIIKFHCIIWPAMLISAGIDPPKQVSAHGFFTVDGKKISKSLGNAIDPLQLAEKYGSDALRYFLFREIPFGGDGDFSEKKLSERYSADLANGYGNLVSRVSTMVAQYLEGKVGTAGSKVKPRVEKLEKEMQTALEGYQLSEALESAWRFIADVDKKIQDSQPWVMAKSGKSKELTQVLSDLHFGVTRLTELLEPFIPETAVKALKSLKAEKVEKIPPLFPRIA